MIQEYLFELDSKTAAQAITVIGGQAAFIHYLLPGISAKKWGLQHKDPIVLWLVERTGLINLQMAFACFLLFFYNFEVRDVMNLVFVTWALDSLNVALFTTIPGGNNVLHKRGHWVNFAISSSILACNFLIPSLGKMATRLALFWALFNGLTFTLFPRYGLYQWGLTSDKKGCHEALFRIHGGSLMQIAAFGLSLLGEMDATKSLSRAMMLQVSQIFFSRYILHEDEKLGWNKDASNFWILLYIPAIASLLG